METIKVCWKEVSINFKISAFLVSGGLWAPPAMLLPEKHYLMVFFPLCVCVSDFRVECIKHQKIHWPGLEMLHLFKVESDRRHCKIWDKVISKWLVSTPCPCWCSVQGSMFMRFTPSLHRSCCDICCCSLTHTWDLEVLTSSKACLLLQDSDCWQLWMWHVPLGRNMRKYFCEERKN